MVNQSISKKNQNIGLILEILPHGGGTYQWTINILHALNDYGKSNLNIQIHIFYFTECDEYDLLKSEFQDFHFHRIGKITKFLSKVLTKIFTLAPFTISPLRSLYPLNIFNRIKNIDTIIIPGASFNACFYRNKPIFMFTDIAHVFFPHFPEVSAGGGMKRRNLIFKYGCKYADRIVVDSKQLAKDIAKYYLADESKIEVLYQTFPRTVGNKHKLHYLDDKDVNIFRNKLPGKYIFYPAQLWEHKNHKNLLRAMKLLLAEGFDIELILCGSRKDGDEQIFSLINELGLEDKVNYLGYVADKFMFVLYRNAEALVMPTYFGPTNIPTLEAFRYGCPAIISDIPGVTEQTGDAAILFDPDSPQDMADKIGTVLKDRDLRQEMIRKGSEKASLLSYEIYKKRFFDILDKNSGIEYFFS